MSRIEWITYKNKKIVYADYSNLNSTKPEEEKELINAIHEVKNLIASLSEKTLFLTNATNSVANTNTINALKEVTKLSASKGNVEKECIVGITGIKKTLLSTVNYLTGSKVKSFDTLQEAKDWLVS